MRRSASKLQDFILTNRGELRRIPDLLPIESQEAAVLRQLVALVLGNPTNAVPQCSALWMPGVDGFASAVYLGNQVALTAGHAVPFQSSPYFVSLPITEVVCIVDNNSFSVAVTPSSEVDLAVLKLSHDPQVPALAVASGAEIAAAGAVQLCGFGSDICDLPSRAGIKRLSDPSPLFANPPGFQFDPATQFVVKNTTAAPLTCTSDSGGAALITAADGILKLAGIICDQLVAQDGTQIGVLCVRVAPFLDWIRKAA